MEQMDSSAFSEKNLRFWNSRRQEISERNVDKPVNYVLFKGMQYFDLINTR